MSTCAACGAAVDPGATVCGRCGVARAGSDEVTVAAATHTHPGPVRAVTPSTRVSFSGGFDHGRFAPGTLLGSRYRIVALLGRGGMGEVYRADDLTLGQSVALKFLPPGLERDRPRLERFLGEIRTARQVSHPNVCRVYDVGEIDGHHFLSMEYVDGEDLAALLRRIGRLPPDKGLDIARQICAGLAASHDRGVLHRDLKPANVMLDGRGKARITDFGLAGALDDVGRGSAEIAGTPAYMAPEQLAGGPLSVQTDLYALGLLLFELFTGRRVHSASSLEELRQRQARTPSESISSGSGDLDPAIERIIERCLDPDPRRRPMSAIAVAAALPGGDPLAAALAAGETPSPQMVAAAGDKGGLAPMAGAACLAGVILLIAVCAWPGRYHYLVTAPMPFSSDVLAVKAGEILHRLGYTDPPADTATGYVTRSDYRNWIDTRDRSPERWSHVGTARPGPVSFWRRTSPAELEPIAGNDAPVTAVTPTDPPSTSLAGMTSVELHPDGRLLRLLVVPPQIESGGPPASEVDWSALFAEAGLDPKTFTPTTSTWIAPVFADTRAAWTGAAPDGSGEELRIEAAAFRGRPVYFQVVAPWTRPDRLPDTSTRGWQAVSLGVLLTVFVVCWLTTGWLAHRNIRLGRGDRRGALRLSTAAILIIALSGWLQSDHFSAQAELNVIVTVVAWALFFGALIWTFYIAVEPFMRRQWPHILIAWTRLLAGHWRDPLVGRDLLLGVAAGCTVHLVGERLNYWLVGARGAPPLYPAQPEWELLEGWASVFAMILKEVTGAVILALLMLVVLLVLRTVLRSAWIATAGLTLLLFVVGTPFVRDPLVELPLGLLAVSTAVAVLTRLGLLAYAALGFTASILVRFQPVFAPGVHVPAMALAAFVLVALAAFGFYTALAGRPLIAARLLDD